MWETGHSGFPYTEQIIFRGRVQGVGFRFTTCRVAEDFPVTGYVRNCPDGTVELYVQGYDGDVNAFVREICRVMEDYIEDVSREQAAEAVQFADFAIRM